MAPSSSKLHYEYQQDLQFQDLLAFLESYLCRSKEQQSPAELFVIILFY
jgi:hypothetical protein